MNKYFLFLVFMITSTVLFSQDLLKVPLDKTTSHNSENYRSFTFDGAWCWFSDPRAIYFKGKHARTYVGWMDSLGSVVIAYYDHDTKEIDSTT